MTRYTGILGIVEKFGGAGAADRLALQAGGTEMKLSARRGSRLVELVGEEAAKAVVDAYGATKVVIPMGHLRGARGRRAAAAQLLAKGVPQAQVALTVDVHQRTVERIAAKTRDDTPDLFNNDNFRD